MSVEMIELEEVTMVETSDESLEAEDGRGRGASTGSVWFGGSC